MNRYQNFTILINKISREIRRIKNLEMKEYGLKSPHVSCLYSFYKEKKLTSKQLADICEEDKAAISRTIDYLEKNGYIVCESDAKKRYRDYFKLTEKGLLIGEILSNKIDMIVDEASKELSDEHKKLLYESLEVISTNLENHQKSES